MSTHQLEYYDISQEEAHLYNLCNVFLIEYSHYFSRTLTIVPFSCAYICSSPVSVRLLLPVNVTVSPSSSDSYTARKLQEVYITLQLILQGNYSVYYVTTDCTARKLQVYIT